MQSMLMGNFSLFPFLLKYQNNAILGAEATYWARLVAGGCGTKSDLWVNNLCGSLLNHKNHENLPPPPPPPKNAIRYLLNLRKTENNKI